MAKKYKITKEAMDSIISFCEGVGISVHTLENKKTKTIHKVRFIPKAKLVVNGEMNGVTDV